MPLQNAARLPSVFIPHGGGPCFFMPDPGGTWTGMADFLRTLPARLPRKPKAILLVSGHWETDGFAFTGAVKPSLLYDYYGFPSDTYALKYDVPGDPALASQAANLLARAGLDAMVDHARGLDHGVFVPLKVAFPDASIPVVEMSVDHRLDPALHLKAGNALAGLRDEGVAIIASGMSFHNMRGYNDPAFTAPSQAFDAWLSETAALDGPARARRLTLWESAPGAHLSHPAAEHLLPLMVAAGASENPGRKIYSEQILKTAIAGFEFD
jgi:aromatic ring-opening dioxygenase catalytic subunit (LigB family)